MASQEEGQNLPDRFTSNTYQTHNRDHRLAKFGTQHALPVIVHVQPSSPASRAEGASPIAVGIADAPLVCGVVGDFFGDEGAAFLRGRTQPNQAGLIILRGRESILTHETLQCPWRRTLKCLTSSYNLSNNSHLPGLFTLKASTLAACLVTHYARRVPVRFRHSHAYQCATQPLQST